MEAVYTDAGGGVPGTLLTTGSDTSVELADFGSTYFGDYASATIDLKNYALAPGNYWIALQEGAWGSAYDGSSFGWLFSLNDTSGVGSASTSRVRTH